MIISDNDNDDSDIPGDNVQLTLCLTSDHGHIISGVVTHWPMVSICSGEQCAWPVTSRWDPDTEQPWRGGAGAGEAGAGVVEDWVHHGEHWGDQRWSENKAVIVNLKCWNLLLMMLSQVHQDDEIQQDTHLPLYTVMLRWVLTAQLNILTYKILCITSMAAIWRVNWGLEHTERPLPPLNFILLSDTPDKTKWSSYQWIANLKKISWLKSKDF